MGSLAATGSKWEPYRLLGPADQRWGAVASFFGDCLRLGAARPRSARMGWTCCAGFDSCGRRGGVDRATRLEARDFCRWLAITNGRRGSGRARRIRFRCGCIAKRCCAAFTISTATSRRPMVNPFPLDRSRRVAARTRITTRWSRMATGGPGCIGRGWSNGSRQHPGCGVQRYLCAAALASRSGVGGVLRFHWGASFGAADCDARRCRSWSPVDHGGVRALVKHRSCRRRRTRSCGCGCIRWRWRG